MEYRPACVLRIREAVRAVEAILKQHGEKPGEFQNRLMFLAPDANALATLRDQVRRFLSWKSIVDDAEELNLDKHHEKEAKKNLQTSTERVEGSIKETYRFLMVPMQGPDAPDGLTKVIWEDEALIDDMKLQRAEAFVRRSASAHCSPALSRISFRSG